jgi:adenylate cyclase
VALKDLRAEIDDEVSTLLASDFAIEVTNTQYVPSASDAAITFPDVTARSQGTKLIETCVLYIDIRRSTELSFKHHAPTVARLYTAFVRAMTRVARHYGGHVRGIIGDRVMVIFDRDKCFTNAVSCAIAMNSVATYIINKRFKANEVECGIGIDFGRMLATKTGVRRHGVEQANYRSLVWLGRPANTASKLTDLANKPELVEEVPVARVAYERTAGFAGVLDALGISPPSNPSPYSNNNLSALGALFDPPPARNTLGTNPSAMGGLFGLAAAAPSNSEPAWEWKDVPLKDFVSKLDVEHGPFRIVHKDPSFKSFYITTETRTKRVATPAILMTAEVWKGFRSEQPNNNAVTKNLFKRVGVRTPGYQGVVFGGNVIFLDLRDA